MRPILSVCEHDNSDVKSSTNEGLIESIVRKAHNETPRASIPNYGIAMRHDHVPNSYRNLHIGRLPMIHSQSKDEVLFMSAYRGISVSSGSRSRRFASEWSKKISEANANIYTRMQDRLTKYCHFGWPDDVDEVPSSLSIKHARDIINLFEANNISLTSMDVLMDGGIEFYIVKDDGYFMVSSYNDGGIVVLHQPNEGIADVGDIDIKQLISVLR